MCSAECVVDIDLSHGSHFLGEGGIVLGLFLVEANVLKKQDLTGLQSCSLSLSVLTDNVLSHLNLNTKQLGKASSYGSERELYVVVLSSLKELLGSGCALLLGKGLNLLLLLLVKLKLGVEDVVGAAEVRAKDHSGTLFKQILDRGQCTNDTLVIGDLAVLHGDVEVAASNDFLAGNGNVFDCFLVVGHDRIHLSCFWDFYNRIYFIIICV